MTAIIMPRVFWGDYGDLLMHGLAFEREEAHVNWEVPNGTIIYHAVYPMPRIVFPYGFFICHSTVKDILSSHIPSLRFAPVFIDVAVHVPWRKWIQRGSLRYPKSGEPFDYFKEYEAPDDFEPGFSEEYWSLEIDDFAIIDEGFVSDGRLPQVLSPIPAKPFVWGGIKPRLRCGRVVFCDEKVLDLLWDFREVLDIFLMESRK